MILDRLVEADCQAGSVYSVVCQDRKKGGHRSLAGSI